MEHNPKPLNNPTGIAITDDARAALDRLDSLTKRKAREATGLGSGRARGFGGRIVSRLIVDNEAEVIAALEAEGIAYLLRRDGCSD